MGGTSYRLLEASSPNGRLIGIDQDPQAIEVAERYLAPFGSRIRLICANFRDLKTSLSHVGVTRIHGALFDLGLSSAQLSDGSRGFSFLENGALDMRMAPTMKTTAGELLNTLSWKELAELIFRFGEERYAKRIAKAVVAARAHSPLSTTVELVDIIRRAVPPAYRHGRLHCATRTFQALRIAVNRELEILEQALRDAVALLLPEGRLAVITFHSLEDRIVKHTFRALAQQPQALVSILTKKPVEPSLTERQGNPRARSAKLRVVERTRLAIDCEVERTVCGQSTC